MEEVLASDDGSKIKIVYDVKEYHCEVRFNEFDADCLGSNLDHDTPTENDLVMAVKWDGCANISTPDVAWHVCNLKDFARWNQLLEHAYKKAFMMIPKRDGAIPLD